MLGVGYLVKVFCTIYSSHKMPESMPGTHMTPE